jgi:hypothetical protein
MDIVDCNHARIADPHFVAAYQTQVVRWCWQLHQQLAGFRVSNLQVVSRSKPHRFDISNLHAHHCIDATAVGVALRTTHDNVVESEALDPYVLVVANHKHVPRIPIDNRARY